MNNNNLLTKNDISSQRPVVATTSGAVLGALIVQLREDRHISQKDLAKAVGMSPSTWSRIERGDSGLSIEHLKNVAKVLELTPWDLLKHADENEKTLKGRGIYIDESFSSPKALVDKLKVAKDTKSELGQTPIEANALSGSALGALGVAGSVTGIGSVALLGPIVSIAGYALAAMLRVNKNSNDKDIL